MATKPATDFAINQFLAGNKLAGKSATVTDIVIEMAIEIESTTSFFFEKKENHLFRHHSVARFLIL